MSDEAAAVTTDDEAQTEEAASGSETTHEFPSFDVELPAELAALLEEDEISTEVTDDELDALSEENEDVPREILARMRSAEKRAEHLEHLRVQEAKKNWGEEAAKFFPLSEPFLSDINANSRRGFLRTAKEVHEKMLPIVEEKILAPARAAIEAKKDEAVTEGKEQAKAAWGEAVTQGAPSEATVTLQNTERRRRNADLGDTIKAMIFPKGA